MRTLAIAFAALCCLCLPARATTIVTCFGQECTISGDRGGQIGMYLQALSVLKQDGAHITIDGDCLSACTLALGVIPRDHLTVTSRARFGFHAAWMPDSDGRPVTSPLGTQALRNIYPPGINRWINRHGGLSRKMFYMSGAEYNHLHAPHRRALHRIRTASAGR